VSYKLTQKKKKQGKLPEGLCFLKISNLGKYLSCFEARVESKIWLQGVESKFFGTTHPPQGHYNGQYPLETFNPGFGGLRALLVFPAEILQNMTLPLTKPELT